MTLVWQHTLRQETGLAKRLANFSYRPPMYQISDRFRGYLPVVVDLETGGFSKEDNPILEVA